MTGKTRQQDGGLRLIALIKMGKAILITGLAIGLFRAIDRNLAESVRNLTIRLRIDPESHLIRILLEKITSIPPKRIHTFGILSLVYAAELYVEGIGLWFNQSWAEYLLVIATGFWIPEESYACIKHFSMGRFSLFLLNVAVLIYVIMRMVKNRKQATAAGASGK